MVKTFPLTQFLSLPIMVFSLWLDHLRSWLNSHPHIQSKRARHSQQVVIECYRRTQKRNEKEFHLLCNWPLAVETDKRATFRPICTNMPSIIQRRRKPVPPAPRISNCSRSDLLAFVRLYNSTYRAKWLGIENVYTNAFTRSLALLVIRK